MKILLVEDNLLNQKIVGFHLRKFNYEVISVIHWKDAIAVVTAHMPDLILMDIMLPEKNGYEITEEIREFEKKKGCTKLVPIIALTANTLDNDKEKCLAAGMNDYLSKPFTAEDLHRMILKNIK